jgi:hypothetical protein
VGDRPLVLHETIDIVGQGQYAYMEHVAREPVQQMPGMMRLQGTFALCAMGGGRWPRCVNVWDLGDDGWDAWGRNVDRLNLKRRAAFYEDWWDEAMQWRTGGYDRLCGGGPSCPTTTEIAASGVRGTLFVQEILEVRPGARAELLAAVAEERAPVLRDYDHRLVGSYEVLGNAHEVVVLWATDVESQVRLRRNADTTRGLSDRGEPDERLPAWDRLAAKHVTGGEAVLMTPLPGTVYGPDEWPDASLDDWLPR